MTGPSPWTNSISRSRTRNSWSSWDRADAARRPPSDASRTRISGRGRNLHRRPPRERPRSERAQHRDGVPELRLVPAHDRVPEHGISVGERKGRGARDHRTSEPNRKVAPSGDPLAPKACAAQWWPAAARRRRPGDRPRAPGLPDGRAAQQPRRETPGPYARRTETPPERPRCHDDLRDARPSRGDDDGGPRGAVEQRGPPAI